VRRFLIITGLLLLASCDRQYKDCFEAALIDVRKDQGCNELWQACEKKARQTAEESCAAFKADD
jgi:hypothetical protein